ncbi:lipid II:glycine glycyltransferase FemX [Georgenia sp. Z1344]|uniref:lipid II:glycine glycyltransferase FemX n=1 Tax=Georgenia sp. Z1344 TaxID=3416706 RepID=UPI003CF697C4
MSRSQIVPLTPGALEDAVAGVGGELPVEQSEAWDAYDEAMPGREPAGRLAWLLDGEPQAVLALTRLRGRGFTYLWAKHGPIWLTPDTPEAERAFRRALTRSLRAAEPRAAFVRLHARHRADDLHELLQSVTFDRTVVLDLAGTADADTLLASMKKRGRRDVRKAGRNEDLVPGEETGIDADGFAELYALLEETAERDEFGIAAASQYTTMLDSLGPEHGRLFVVRDREGRPLCWGIVTVGEGLATYYYAASSHAGRRAGAPDLLVWHMAATLQAEGVRTFDLMGIDSDRAPRLTGVRDFKTKFSNEVTEVPGAWDVPLRPVLYRTLTAALAGKRRAVAAVGAARARVSGGASEEKADEQPGE